jgi:NTP pyrophosphatase (non-canonical NTP hydrolase)
MRFHELCRKVLEVYDQYAAENRIVVSEDYAILKLVEEVGEFAQAVIIQRGMSKAQKRLPAREAQRAVAAELSDILGLTILVADRIGVDLQEAIREKWLRFLERRPATRSRPVRRRSVRARR